MRIGQKHQNITQTHSPILLNQSYAKMQNNISNNKNFHENRNSDANK